MISSWGKSIFNSARSGVEAVAPSGWPASLPRPTFNRHLGQSPSGAPTGTPFTAQITRGDAEALALRDGDTVYVRATRIPPIADGAVSASLSA